MENSSERVDIADTQLGGFVALCVGGLFTPIPLGALMRGEWDAVVAGLLCLSLIVVSLYVMRVAQRSTEQFAGRVVPVILIALLAGVLGVGGYAFRGSYPIVQIGHVPFMIVGGGLLLVSFWFLYQARSSDRTSA